jgi:AcrR family transcriptional regulator
MRSSGEVTFTERARREQIVGCAIEAIAELGYNQASIRKIAERVGVSMSVVLYHFGTKDELVAAIVAELYRSVFEVMVPAVEAQPTASGKLAAHIRAHVEYIATHPSHQVALVDIHSNYRSRSGQRLDQLAIDPSQAAVAERIGLESIVALGVESGEFRAVSASSMAAAVRGAIGGAVMASLRDSEFDVRSYGEDLVELFDRAMRG